MSKRGPGLAIVCLTACLVAACSPEPESAGEPMSVGERLSVDTTGYPAVTRPRAFRFPADHGAHPRYRHEWWYLTGQAETAAGRAFGFQFTIFREAVAREPVDSPSKWATRQLYLAHLAVSDLEGGRHLADERFARGALGLAGARAEPLKVWLEDWRLEGRAATDGSLEARVTAASEEFGLDLALESERAPVAHGDRGMSRKGPEGNASYYYSYTRLRARGTIRVGGQDFEVDGSAWFDHEWSSSALAADQAGWDWFSLRLDDGTDLMMFRLRHGEDPQRDFYSGTLVAAGGEAVPLDAGEIAMEALAHWTSEVTGARYPVSWRLTVPGHELVLRTEARMNAQEMDLSFRYWEGAVRVAGKRGDRPVSGQGYVELTGYTSAGGRP